jgi:predicted aspartyl protease
MIRAGGRQPLSVRLSTPLQIAFAHSRQSHLLVSAPFNARRVTFLVKTGHSNFAVWIPYQLQRRAGEVNPSIV